MRVSIIVVLVVGMLVSRVNQPVLADTPFSGENRAGSVVIDSYVKYGDYVGVTEENPPVVEFSQKLVQNVQIRFLNDKGQSVDDKGQPLVGRTQRDFIIGLLKLKPGQVFSNDALQADLEQLRKLNSFDLVRVDQQEDASGVNIIYDIKERSFPVWNFGAGSNDDIGLYGQVIYEDANISGLNDQLASTVQISGKDIQFNSQFTSPYRLAQNDRFGYSIRVFRDRNLSPTFDDDIRLPNDDRVREGRFGGSVALLRPVDDWDTSLALNYTRISLRDRDYDVNPVDELGNPISVSGTGIDDLFTLSFAASRDQRDRSNNPTQGSILTLSTEQAIPIGLGNISSNRLRGNYIQYVPVRWLGNEKITDNPEMLAVNLQLGTIIGDFPS